MYHSESPQQQAFHTWTFNLSISWNSPLLPIHQMMTIIVFLSPLKSLITLKSEDPTHQELEDPAEWRLNVYGLIYAIKQILIMRNVPDSERVPHENKLKQNKLQGVSKKGAKASFVVPSKLCPEDLGMSI